MQKIFSACPKSVFSIVIIVKRIWWGWYVVRGIIETGGWGICSCNEWEFTDTGTMSASILRRVWAQNAASPVRCSNQYAIAVVVPELSYNQTYELQWRLAYWVSLYSVESQLLNCVFDNSRIVIFTIQELWKSQCNNTDINNTDYSDTDPFLSVPFCYWSHGWDRSRNKKHLDDWELQSEIEFWEISDIMFL